MGLYGLISGTRKEPKGLADMIALAVNNMWIDPTNYQSDEGIAKATEQALNFGPMPIASLESAISKGIQIKNKPAFDAVENRLGDTLNRVTTSVPTPISPAKFYRTYYQHKLLRGNEESTIESIMKNGFKSGIGPNARPIMPPTSEPTIMDINYGAKKGDTILLIPKEFIKNTPNGPKIKDGYIPKKSEIIKIETDNPDIYELYRRMVESK